VEIPQVWFRFGCLVHQDFIDDHADIFSGFSTIFEAMSAADRQELAGFLAHVVAHRTPEELSEIWYASEAQIWIEPKGFPRFYSELLRLVNEALYRDR
jgi:hypothetical protein